MTMEIEQATCAVCGNEMQAVRPGKHQCDHCETVEHLEQKCRSATNLAGELIAVIRVNVMRGTFRETTIQQVDEHLKPWVERLAELRPAPPASPTNDQSQAPRP